MMPWSWNADIKYLDVDINEIAGNARRRTILSTKLSSVLSHQDQFQSSLRLLLLQMDGNTLVGRSSVMSLFLDYYVPYNASVSSELHVDVACCILRLHYFV
jgi:hypothetical protein